MTEARAPAANCATKLHGLGSGQSYWIPIRDGRARVSDRGSGRPTNYRPAPNPDHLHDLKALFVYAPDIKITVHPIRFGSGSWTGVTGIMTGTFSKPMPIGNGKSIPSTGKRFALSMATIAQWKDGKIAHEWLFWDNHDFMKQIGLAQ